jgi:hypothetical protein
MYVSAQLEKEFAGLTEASPVPESRFGMCGMYCIRCKGQLSYLDKTTVGAFCSACKLVYSRSAHYQMIEVHPHG